MNVVGSAKGNWPMKVEKTKKLFLRKLESDYVFGG